MQAPQGKFAEAGGVKLHYLIAGQSRRSVPDRTGQDGGEQRPHA